MSVSTSSFYPRSAITSCFFSLRKVTCLHMLTTTHTERCRSRLEERPHSQGSHVLPTELDIGDRSLSGKHPKRRAQQPLVGRPPDTRSKIKHDSLLGWIFLETIWHGRHRGTPKWPELIELLLGFLGRSNANLRVATLQVHPRTNRRSDSP